MCCKLMKKWMVAGSIAALGAWSWSCSRPLAAFAVEGSLQAPAAVAFNNTSQKATAFRWDFGDGATSTEVSPEHEYKASGTYQVVLTASDGKKSTKLQQPLVIKAPDRCLVEIETSLGTMLVQLSDGTPHHRDNFLKLAEQGYFNDLLFHRVINGFMIQGGDPNSRNAAPGVALGNGGPDYTVPAEFVDSLIHLKGALAAARTGDAVNPEKRSSGSQFYLVQGRPVTVAQLDQLEARKGFRYSTAQREAYLKNGGTPFLDRDYTVFGHVVKGLDVLDKIASVETGPADRPKQNVTMRIRVIK